MLYRLSYKTVLIILLLAVITLPATVLTAATAKTAASAPHRTRFYPKRERQPKASNPPGVSVVNAASFLPGISPGSLASIFGADISGVTGIVVANPNPLPTELAGVEVLVNGISAPLFVVANTNGQTQINFQVPWETDTGPAAADIEVLDFGDTVATIETDSFTADPGIFTSEGYALAVRAVDWSLIRPGNAASPGETVILYATGLGPVSLDVPDGEPAPASPLARTQDPFDVLLDGEPCQVLFSGLAPGFVGVYQLNLVLPPDLPPGDLDLQISTPFATSGITKFPIF
jgi:uncharacterized protein (TIGR03437 family)